MLDEPEVKEDSAQYQERERDGYHIKQERTDAAGECIVKRDDNRCGVNESVGDDTPDSRKIQEHVAFRFVFFNTVKDWIQHDIRGDTAGNGYCQEISGYSCHNRRVFHVTSDITNDLLNLVLLLQESGDHCPTEDDDPKCRKYPAYPGNNPLHGRVRCHASKKPEQGCTPYKGEERGDPVPQAEGGDEGKGDHKREDGIHVYCSCKMIEKDLEKYSGFHACRNIFLFTFITLIFDFDGDLFRECASCPYGRMEPFSSQFVFSADG